MVNKRHGGGRGKRFRVAAWGTAAALILLPLLAMALTTEVMWTAAQLVFACGLVAGVGLSYELAARTTAGSAYWTAVGIALASAFILIVVNGAVGGGVLAVGIVGAIIARFRASGMARALVATALAQTLVAVIAFFAGYGFTGPITVFFAGQWLISAWLFWKAAAEQTPASAAARPPR